MTFETRVAVMLLQELGNEQPSRDKLMQACRLTYPYCIADCSECPLCSLAQFNEFRNKYNQRVDNEVI